MIVFISLYLYTCRYLDIKPAFNDLEYIAEWQSQGIYTLFELFVNPFGENMYKCYLVNKFYEPLVGNLEPIPYETSDKAVTGAGKILLELDCNLIWMKNINPEMQNLTQEDKIAAVYSGEKDICVLITGLTLTEGTKENPTPLEAELGPFYLRS